MKLEKSHTKEQMNHRGTDHYFRVLALGRFAVPKMFQWAEFYIFSTATTYIRKTLVRSMSKEPEVQELCSPGFEWESWLSHDSCEFKQVTQECDSTSYPGSNGLGQQGLDLGPTWEPTLQLQNSGSACPLCSGAYRKKTDHMLGHHR